MVKLQFDVELSEWEVIKANTELEVVDCEYSGFTGVLYKDKKYYINNGYLVKIPVMN